MTKFHQRLAAAFKYPVEEYELVGSSEGESACACGHPIKNIFTVACNGHMVELGSECIETYAGLEGVRLQVQAQREREKALAKAHKEHMENQELMALITEYHALLAPWVAKVQNNVRIPYSIYSYVYGYKGYRISQLKTLKGKIKKVQAALTALKKVLEQNKGAA
jgi:hypothetical protein